jgi:SAM-dependent methyltransferase
MGSERRFGFEWSIYSTLDPMYEIQFKQWVTPLAPSDFARRTVIDAGCGMGRNSYWALRWGAGRLTAFDFDERSVEATRQNLREFSNAEVLFRSIYDIDWRDEYDIALSIGVLHHLEHPRRALANMVRALRPGGILLFWVYSREGNEWILRFVDPVRKSVTSRLPVGLVHRLSYVCSVPLWGFVKTYRGGNEYLRQLSRSKFWQVHSIVFDQLIPVIAHYWKKDEVIRLLNDLPLREIRIQHPPNGQGWTVLATKT